MKFLWPIECDFSCESTGQTLNGGNVSKTSNEMHFVAAHINGSRESKSHEKWEQI